MASLFPIFARSRVSPRCLKLSAARKRLLATDNVPAKPSGASTFFQRLSSFVVGAGVTAIGTQYYIFTEIHESNKAMIQKQASLEKRLAALEKKK
mmetsp:Transcript_3359/g.4562  ORF Transcript_3359/g.4562 Transcript_3359/m.4562 type:complete len:95 (+) Transcript_3359:89-373(+)